MKLIIINYLNHLLPDKYFDFFNQFNTELIVIKEMGPYKFIIYIFFISFFFLSLFLFSKKIRIGFFFDLLKKHIWIIFFILILSFFINYETYEFFTKNPKIFYDTSHDQIIYRSSIYLYVFSLTNIIFYFFSYNIIENKKISFLITMLWMFSAQHIYNVYPSLFRDYIKVLLFYINFIFIIYFLKNKITGQNLFLVFWWLFFICFSILIKADLKLIFPIFLYIIFIKKIFKFNQKNLFFFFIILLIILVFTYLVSSIYPSRDMQRFGASLGGDLYNFDTNYSLGPFEDSLFFYKSCAHYQCNQIKFFLYTSFYQFNLEVLKFFKILSDILLLPFKNNLISNNPSILNNILYYKSILLKPILSLKYFYFLLIIFFLFFYTLKKMEIIHLLIIFAYISYIYSLENLLRHSFYLEGVSLIVFYLVLKDFMKNLYNIFIK